MLPQSAKNQLDFRKPLLNGVVYIPSHTGEQLIQQMHTWFVTQNVADDNAIGIDRR